MTAELCISTAPKKRNVFSLSVTYKMTSQRSRTTRSAPVTAANGCSAERWPATTSTSSPSPLPELRQDAQLLLTARGFIYFISITYLTSLARCTNYHHSTCFSGWLKTEAGSCPDCPGPSGRDPEFVDHARDHQLPDRGLASGRGAQGQVHLQGEHIHDWYGANVENFFVRNLRILVLS
jgi:hypothetical protein